MSGVFLLTVCTVTLHAAVPKGWYVRGSKPIEYEAGIDALATHDSRPSAFLRSKQPVVHGFGTLMQDFRADRYLGKRVRFSAFVKSDDARDWAGLWMRVDKGRKQLAFDNMHDRPIKGTTDWRRYEVVLDVPQDATGIFFGVLLSGAASIWINDVKFEVVGPIVLPSDGDQLLTPDEPTNLDFEE